MINRLPLYFWASALLAGSLTLTGCVVGEEGYATDEAWSEIYAAIDFKKEECGNEPEQKMLVPPNPPTYGTQLCSISIIRMECPFDHYPILCLEMYGVDIPAFGP